MSAIRQSRVLFNSPLELPSPETVPLPKRVLIADDSDRVRAVIRSFVEKQPGVEVCALTHDGVETVDVAAALQPDLLILDVLVPGLNGIEVASVLKKKDFPAPKPSCLRCTTTWSGRSLRQPARTPSLPKATGFRAFFERFAGF